MFWGDAKFGYYAVGGALLELFDDGFVLVVELKKCDVFWVAEYPIAIGVFYPVDVGF